MEMIERSLVRIKTNEFFYQSLFFCSIAVYFEAEKNQLQAGKFYYRAGEYSKVRHVNVFFSLSQEVYV